MIKIYNSNILYVMLYDYKNILELINIIIIIKYKVE